MLRKDNIKGEINARTAHEKVGKTVRKTIAELGGTVPEDLPAETSLKRLEREVRQQQALPDDSGKEEQKK